MGDDLTTVPGVGGWMGSVGVPITPINKTDSRSRSPVFRMELDEDEEGWEARSITERTGSELGSSSNPSSPFSGRFKFMLVVGTGVLDFEPDVTGRGLVFFRFVGAIGTLASGKSLERKQ
jgi:hypothetical protein